jgi:hypothetical protein
MTYVVDDECYACDDECCLVGYDTEMESTGGVYHRPMYQILDPAYDHWVDAVNWPTQTAYALIPVILDGKELA